MWLETLPYKVQITLSRHSVTIKLPLIFKDSVKQSFQTTNIAYSYTSRKTCTYKKNADN